MIKAIGLKKIVATVIAGACVCVATRGFSADAGKPAPAAPASPAAQPMSAVMKQLQDIVARINVKIGQGKKASADYTEELEQFDALIRAHEKEKTEDVAYLVWMKGVLYLQVFDQPAKAKEIFQKVKTEFPATKIAAQADSAIAGLEKQEKARKIQESLVVGAKFPDFQEKDIHGKPLSVSNYKGKVVLVDFWATWCGPCRVELPNVIAAYQKHHAKGFEIVGISLDQDLSTMTNYTASSGMVWPQFFDGKVWENKLAQQYGVMSIPATYLVDTKGDIIGRDLRGPDLEKAVADALAKK
jgi:thiol-disulfide isomerase/thioredoxin